MGMEKVAGSMVNEKDLSEPRLSKSSVSDEESVYRAFFK
jgi:hypothetical protein